MIRGKAKSLDFESKLSVGYYIFNIPNNCTLYIYN